MRLLYKSHFFARRQQRALVRAQRALMRDFLVAAPASTHPKTIALAADLLLGQTRQERY
jgi:hypothetical protein